MNWRMAAPLVGLAVAFAGCGDGPAGTLFRADRFHFQVTVPAGWKQGKVSGPNPKLGRRDDFGWKFAQPVAGFRDAQGPVMDVFAVKSPVKGDYVLEGLLGQKSGRTTSDAEPNVPAFRRALIDGRLAYEVDDAAGFGPRVLPRLVFMDFGPYAVAFVLREERGVGDYESMLSSVKFFNEPPGDAS